MEPTSLTDFRPHGPLRAWSETRRGALQLTAYHHAQQRAGDRRLGRALLEECAHSGVKASVLVEGVEGFGRSRRLRTERFEATWNDLPVVFTAADEGVRIIEAAGAVERLGGHGTVTLGSISLIADSLDPLRAFGDGAVELAIHCRSGRGSDDAQGAAGVVEQLRRCGVAGATAVGGREGTIAGEHRGSHVFAHSPDAPAIVTAVDSARVLAGAVPSLLARRHVELVTAKPVWLCKHRGRQGHAGTSPIGDLPRWCKVSVYIGGEARHGHLPVHLALVFRLQKAGALGVTVVRGDLGYAFDAPLRPDHGWFARRRTPMITTIVDEGDRIADWLAIVDELTGADGLVTCETVTVLDDAPA